MGPLQKAVVSPRAEGKKDSTGGREEGSVSRSRRERRGKWGRKGRAHKGLRPLGRPGGTDWAQL